MIYKLLNILICSITSLILFMVFGTAFIFLHKEIGVGSITSQIVWIIFIIIASLKIGCRGLLEDLE